MVSIPRHSSGILGTAGCRLRRNMANGHATDSLSASMMLPVGTTARRESALFGRFGNSLSSGGQPQPDFLSVIFPVHAITGLGCQSLLLLQLTDSRDDRLPWSSSWPVWILEEVIFPNSAQLDEA